MQLQITQQGRDRLKGMIDRTPQAVIKRMLVREVRQFGGLFESRIPIIAKEIAETLEFGKTKREEHE